MSVMSDKELISQLGGATKVARLLGYEMPDGARRVHNWIRRGIPAHVKVQRPDLFMRKQLKKSTRQPASAAA